MALTQEEANFVEEMDVEDDLLSLFTDAAPAANSQALDDLGSDPIETLDHLLWPLLPLYGARAATMEVGGRAYGTITSVDQTVSVPHVLLYVLEYDDGDRMHLDAQQAANAVALALANTATTSPPPRTLKRRDADAHADGKAGSSSRTLTRHHADAHDAEGEWLMQLLRDDELANHLA